ncbi:MAG: uncharacterized protein JWN09_124 [Microbacteriaceae bacterium]|nr:uncharacterized protein [Microbacteriaceae bacterium]
MATLDNSDRIVLKATHTAIKIPPEQMATLGRALDKSAYVRALALRPGEVEAARSSSELRQVSDTVWPTLTQFEQQNALLSVPEASGLAPIPTDFLTAFGKAVIAKRSADLGAAQSGAAVDAAKSPTGDLRIADAVVATQYANTDRDLAALVHAAKQAVSTFSAASEISPIGMLHLERIEMSPAGVERGELLSTIPLAPGESTAVEQKEWSVTDEELSSIVTDSLESYTEKGVTEKSELAQATTSESKRSQQLGVGATLSGSYGFVTFSTTTNFSSAVEASQSRKDSRTQAVEVTQKASSRVRKERKVTIQSKTTTGSQETTTRSIHNPSDTDGMRIDYYSMMRRWRVRLLQYGLRQTYDVAVPSPGATLRKPFESIAYLTALIEAPFTFDVKVADIRVDTYRDLATTWAANVPEPPPPAFSARFGGPVPGLDHGDGWHFNTVDVEVPENTEITHVLLDAFLGNVNNDNPKHRSFWIFGYGPPRLDSSGNPTTDAMGENGRAAFVEDLTAGDGFSTGSRTKQSIQYFIQFIDTGSVSFVVTFSPTAEAVSRWQFAVWQALKDAAADAHYAMVQMYTAQRDAVAASITAIDSLTLRREERDEIMRGVLHWLLGPAFEFMPDEIAALFDDGKGGSVISLTGNDMNINDVQWNHVFRYEEMIKFLHQAIEWENLLYFVYPYFWDVPKDWDFNRTIEHPDLERQQFVRAGSARVVLTVRPGFEESFAQFVDGGSFGEVLPPGHPYVTIGQEIAAYSNTNYPGIPPANPAAEFRPLLTPGERKAWAEIVTIIGALETWHDSHGNVYPTTTEGLAVLPIAAPAADPWGHPYVYVSPGRTTDYELSSMGEDGTAGPGPSGASDDVTSWAPASLIGEWFEYTPTRGVDIAVNSVLADMA